MAESKLVPACWTKRVHVDVTQALAVLWSHCLSTVLEEETLPGEVLCLLRSHCEAPHDHGLPSCSETFLQTHC